MFYTVGEMAKKWEWRPLLYAITTRKDFCPLWSDPAEESGCLKMQTFSGCPSLNV